MAEYRILSDLTEFLSTLQIAIKPLTTKKCIKIEDRLTETPQEHVATAEKLAEENDGVFPNSWWLQKNGFSGVYQSMRKYPKLFKHIKT